MPPRLSVNIDHVATVRQARRASEPDPVAAAVVCDLAGADGITCHLRSDRRHMHDDDLRRLREVVTSHLNVEMAATAEMLRIARATKPDLVTLVPERPGEVTTEGGIDAHKFKRTLAKHCAALRKAGIAASLFIDPTEAQIRASAAIGVGMVELNTNAYSAAKTPDDQARAYDQMVDASHLAATSGLAVAAGHGLTLRNVAPIAEIPEIVELNIGHSIIARAVLVGLDQAVREMKRALAVSMVYED